MSQVSRAVQLQGLALNIAARRGGAVGLDEPAERQYASAIAAMLDPPPAGTMVVLGAGRRLAQMLRDHTARVTPGDASLLFVDDDITRLEWSNLGVVDTASMTRAEAPLDDLRTSSAELSQLLARMPANDLASYRCLQIALDRQRQERPLVRDASVDAVLLDGITAMLPASRLDRVVKEAFRVLRRHGRLVMCGLLLDERIGDACRDGAVAALPLEQEIAGILAAAGYHGITYRWRAELPWKIVDGTEARAFVLDAHKGKQGICLDQGHAVMYRGPWREVLDDDGHRYVRGERTAVCRKTYDLLHRAPYDGQFVGLVPYVLIPEGQAPVFDCATPAARDPAVTKGTRSVAADAAIRCDGPDCC